MSPTANTSGRPGTLQSGFTLMRPALSSSTPSFFVSGDAATPAVHRIVPARMISPLSNSTSPSRISFTRVRGSHVHAQAFQLPLRAFLQIRRQKREHIRRAFEQNNFRLRRIDAPEIPFQNRPRQFRKCAGQFHPRRSAPHDHNRQQLLALRRLRLVLGFFKRE